MNTNGSASTHASPASGGASPGSGLRATLAAQLPYLRRYGRALVGSQRGGDALVRAALEVLVHAPEEFDARQPARVELFRIFHAFWSPIAEKLDGNGDRASLPAVVGEMMLADLPAHRREALLLTALEGFSVDDAATILGRPVESVVDDIAAARAEIARQMAGKVLIIEDEPIIAMDLQGIVEGLGHSVVGIAATHDAALALAGKNEFDLVLADIQLADGSSGIDAVKDILATENVPVIFITAFPERLLTGERPEPTYLITKPFAVDTLVATIGQALMLQQHAAAG